MAEEDVILNLLKQMKDLTWMLAVGKWSSCNFCVFYRFGFFFSALSNSVCAAKDKIWSVNSVTVFFLFANM